MKAPVQFLSNLIHPIHQQGTVTYILSGSPGDFNITYTASHAVTFQEPHITKKWKRSFTVKDGEFVYFSAQSNTRHARLKVKIKVNGKIFRESLAEGDYAIATAAGCIHCDI
jgi:hypothetical protein